MAAGGELILFADADGSTQFGAVNEFKRQIKKTTETSKTDSILICGSRASSVSKSDVEVKVSTENTRFIFIFSFLIREHCLDGY